MPKCDITLLGRTHTVACAEGDESRLAKLAGLVDEKLKLVVGNGPNPVESRLFMLASLMIADELFDLKQENIKLQERLSAALAAQQAQVQEQEDLFVAAVDILKSRISELAGKLATA